MLDQRKAVIAILLLSTLVVGALLVFVVDHQSDPLAQYRTADGRISIPGGKLTKELQSLLFPQKLPDAYYNRIPQNEGRPASERTFAPQRAAILPEELIL